MEWVGNNGCFGVDNQILNAMALGNPDRERYCSICLTQAPWVPRSSQQRISSFSPDIPNASEYPEASSSESRIQEEIAGHRHNSGRLHKQPLQKTGCGILDSNTVQFIFPPQISRQAF